MSQQSMKNHYVPEMYLRNWSLDGNTVWMYRRFVNHKDVRWWSKASICNTAYTTCLYVYAQDNATTDNFEKWLNTEVETPAKTAFEKIGLGNALNKEEMFNLLRFTAAQMIRTPAWYFKKLEPLDKGSILQKVSNRLDESMSQRITDAKLGKRSKIPSDNKIVQMPLKISRIEREEESTFVEYGVLDGRIMWLSQIERASNKLLKESLLSFFLKQQWHIIEAHEEIEWPTSDDPVIMTREYIVNGVEILFPLSPKHLLYTCIDRKFCDREIEKMKKNKVFSVSVWERILEHSFLCVYSKQSQKGMFRHCPRSEDEGEYQRIQKLLYGRENEWNATNSAAEARFFVINEATQ